METKTEGFAFVVEEEAEALISLALREDLGPGDLTTNALIAPQWQGEAVFLARQDLTVCGHAVAARVFSLLDKSTTYIALVGEGTTVQAGAEIARIAGPLRSILSGERTALNFMQRLSGISTITKRYVECISFSKVGVLDTRKTTPGMRLLEKHAIRVGGGFNHRFGLFDAVLIKNNHIDALDGDVKRAVRICRQRCPAEVKIEVEVRTLEELRQALEAYPDAVLIDNMSPDNLSDAVKLTRETSSNVKIEASGGITLENIASYVATGIDYVSVGALTHSAKAVDISLRCDFHP